MENIWKPELNKSYLVRPMNITIPLELEECKVVRLTEKCFQLEWVKSGNKIWYENYELPSFKLIEELK